MIPEEALVPAVPAGSTSGERSHDVVLLVDDDAAARARTAAALSARCWRVIEAGDGSSALDLFARRQPDVVVLEAQMPGLDGFVTCERLRALPGGEHVPVLMLTRPDDESSIKRAYEAGATDFLVKSGAEWALLSERLRYMVRAALLRRELAESSAKLSKAQRIARLGTWEWSIGSRSVRLSEECCAIAGLPAQEGPIADWFIWSRLAEGERDRVEALFREALASRAPLNFDCRVARPSGQVRVVHVEAEIDFDAGSRAVGVHGVAQDVTERRRAEDRIREIANFDSLTGLPNRRFFRDQFQAALDRARSTGSVVGVLFADIDRFKRVNDTLGHQVGDALLRGVAKRIFQCVRENDTVARPAVLRETAGREAADPATGRDVASEAIAPAALHRQASSVARLGGDEFTILLTDLPDADAIERVAQRILAAMAPPFRISGHEVTVTVSIGLATYPADGDDVDTLLRKADIAMYAVKDGGRNGVLRFCSGMTAAPSGRRRLEGALQRALEREELVLYYQPKVNVLDGSIAGAEALMRWRRGGELVAPGEFISVAEESGLIVPITEWAVREVCRQLNRWSEAGMPPVPVSVNISGRNLQRSTLLEAVKTALREVRQDPRLLELELTEGVLMQDTSATLPLLRALKALGVGIAVDDFATGLSSLTALARLPIDTLKIDRSFVRDFDESRESAAIVAAIIALGRSLNLRIAAEGVETQAQMARLVDEGCHLMQGFLFSPAVPGDDFPSLVRAAGSDAHWRLPSSRGVVAATEPAATLHTSLKRGLVRSAASAGADHGREVVRARSA